MPITIWKPREYAEGFATSGVEGSFVPANGEVAAAPYNRDTKIREVTRFTGYTERHYRDTGYFELVIPQGSVEPSDIKAGYLVSVEDYVYMIEDYAWELTEDGYEVTISGRDLGGLLDRHIPTHRRESGSLSAPKRADLKAFLLPFFESYFEYSGDINQALPEKCGWFRDAERMPEGGWIAFEGVAEDQSESAEESSANVEIVSYGEALRIMAGYKKMGYRFDVKYDELLGIHTLQLVLYKPDEADEGILLNSRGRGVSDFSYSFEAQEAVNAAFVFAKSRWVQAYGGTWTQAEEPIHITYMLPFEQEGANWAEVANAWSGVAIDLGEVPEENDLAGGDAVRWMRGQLVDIYREPVETVKFSYDNSGACKYGQHFGLGSSVSIADDYLGVGLTARLTGVTTNYEAGEPKSYDFVFGSERLTQADKLKRRFSYIDRRTYSI